MRRNGRTNFGQELFFRSTKQIVSQNHARYSDRSEVKEKKKGGGEKEGGGIWGEGSK